MYQNFLKQRGDKLTNPIDLGKISSSITINENFTENLYTLNEKATYYLQFELINDSSNGFIQVSEQFIKNANNDYVAQSVITAKIELLDINGSVLNVYQENQDYAKETKLGNIVDQLNTKIMFSDLNTGYLTKLEKGTKYLLKITNLKVNPGSYRIKFNLPQTKSKPAAVSEPLFIKEIDDTDNTYNYNFLSI